MKLSAKQDILKHMKFLALLFVFLFSGAPVLAEEMSRAELLEYYLDATTIEDEYSGDYVRITPQSLSQLYWKLQVFDSGDNRAIDNYMLINECQIYQDNVNNDFEWNFIREAAKQSIKQKREGFTTKFEYFVPVHLSRYDTERRGFFLVNNTGYENVRRMEVNSFVRTDEICGKKGEIKDYPFGVLFILQRPFSFVFAEVDEHVAQAYILRKQEEIIKLPIEIRQSRYERTAYLRFRVNVTEYQGNVRGDDQVLSVLMTELDGIDLFEDANGQRLLSSVVIKKDQTESDSAEDDVVKVDFSVE